MSADLVLCGNACEGMISNCNKSNVANTTKDAEQQKSCLK